MHIPMKHILQKTRHYVNSEEYLFNRSVISNLLIG